MQIKRQQVCCMAPRAYWVSSIWAGLNLGLLCGRRQAKRRAQQHRAVTLPLPWPRRAPGPCWCDSPAPGSAGTGTRQCSPACWTFRTRCLQPTLGSPPRPTSSSSGTWWGSGEVCWNCGTRLRTASESLQRSLRVWGSQTSPCDLLLLTAHWERLGAPRPNGLSPGGARRKDQDCPAPSPLPARSTAAPPGSHPDATRAAQGRSISPFCSFSLEPLDILGRHRSVLCSVHSQLQLPHQPLPLLGEVKPGVESDPCRDPVRHGHVPVPTHASTSSTHLRTPLVTAYICWAFSRACFCDSRWLNCISSRSAKGCPAP